MRGFAVTKEYFFFKKEISYNLMSNSIHTPSLSADATSSTSQLMQRKAQRGKRQSATINGIIQEEEAAMDEH